MNPLGNHRFRVGLTYNRKDQNKGPTQKAQIALQKQLVKMIQVSYQIVSQSEGYRPTSVERRPVIEGFIHNFHNSPSVMVWVLGVLQAPICDKSTL